MSACAGLLSLTVADPDLWGHVKFGQDILQSGQIVQRDTYSYLTGDQPWINHEWLAEFIFAGLMNLGGPRALVLFKTAMALLTTGLVYWSLRRQGLSALRGGIVLMFVVILLPSGVVTVRPQTFTWLLFVVTLLLLDAADRGRLRWLWGIPGVFALWANCHGGFLVGLSILSVWSATRIVASLCRPSRSDSGIRWTSAAFVAATFAGGVATLATPFGVRLLDFLVRPSTVARPEITEWQPIPIASTYGVIYLILLAMALAGLFYSTRERRPAPLVLFLCVAILPLLAVRHLPLFALGIPILAGEHIEDAWNRWPPSARTGHGNGRGGKVNVWLAGIAITLAMVFLWLSLSHFDCIRIDRRIATSFPARAVAVLRESGVSGNLAIYFNWGEYAIWHLSPRIRVSIDGRRETVYSEKAREVNQSFGSGVGDWGRLIQRHDTHMALVSKTTPVFNLLKLSSGWVLAYEDSLSGLFAREGTPLVSQIRAASPRPLPDDGEGLCFP
jgi:hypothetical protein